jgi:dienelactone hydrolase
VARGGRAAKGREEEVRSEGALAALAMLLILACPVPPASSESVTTTAPAVSPAVAPSGAEALAVQWVNVAVPDLGVVLAAVARPPGAGPFPTVIILHGTHGFAHEYVRLARDLAQGGVQAVAACWFRGRTGAGSRFITPIDCPTSPQMPGGSSPEAVRIVAALVHAARTLPGADPDQIGLFGHSRGAGAVLTYILDSRSVPAAVLNSGGYPRQFIDLAPKLATPILILHGTADDPADGGVAVTNVEMARGFEAALRAAGKPVEAVYYEGGRHNGLFSDDAQYREEVSQILAFLIRRLRS